MIGFLSYNSDSPDSFQFITLSSIDTDQVIHFTDNGVTSSGSFRLNEGVISWTAPSGGIPLGTIVSVDATSLTVSVGSISLDGSLNFSSSGDQLIAFTGTVNKPTFIAALNNEGSSFQDDATNSQSSALPPGLTLGVNAVAVREFNNVVYDGPTVGSLSTLSQSLFDPTSFQGSDSERQTFRGSFTITDVDLTNAPTIESTNSPTKLPTTRAPTPSGSSVSSSRCQGYRRGPSISSEATQITEANRLAKSGSRTTVTIEGIVVNDLRQFAARGFYVQALTSHIPYVPVEGENINSHGIFVYCESGCNGHNVEEGEFVKVTGTLSVFSENPQIESTTVELISPTVPSPVEKCPNLAYEVHIVDFSLPMQNLRSLFSFQGMLMNFQHPLVITDLFGLTFGQLGLAKDRLINPTMQVKPGSAEYFVAEESNERNLIILDDVVGGTCPVPQLYFDPTKGIRAGWEVGIDSNAVMTYFGVTEQFFLVPNSVGRQNIPNDFVKTNPRETKLPSIKADELRFAGLNMLNYFTTFGCSNCRGADNSDEFFRQSNKLYAVIKELDAAVLGLQEVQNFNGEVLEQMISEINSFVGVDGKYEFIAAGTIGSDAIKNAIIYQPSKVIPSGRHAILTYTNPSNKSRPSLAQTFKRSDGSGESFTFVSNHWKSKGSGCDEDNGSSNALEGEGSCGFTRMKHAEQLVDWLRTDPTKSGNENYILAGDFNSYKEERSIQVLLNAGFINLAERDVEASSLYSSSFDGRFGTLDYIFASSKVASSCGETKEWHINSDETALIDYNDEQSSRPSSCLTKPPAYTDLSVFRSSDHDPILTHCVEIGKAFTVPTTSNVPSPFSPVDDNNENDDSFLMIVGIGAIGIVVLGLLVGIAVKKYKQVKKSSYKENDGHTL